MKTNIPGIWVCFCIFFIGNFLGVQRGYAQDRRAEKVIQDSQNFYYGLRDMSVDFTYEVKGTSSPQRPQKGTIQIKKARYVLTMRDQETYCDTRRIWVYLPQRNEYMEFDMGEWTYGNIMQLIYSMYFYNSDVSYEGVEILRDGKRTHKIRFRMDDPKINYSTAYAWYNESDKLLSRVTFLDRNKRQRSYSFYNIRYNMNLDDDYFVFRPQDYPGIELRR